MTYSLQTKSIQCPYCGEQIEVIVDCSVNNQEYVEDCSVCCKPIIFSVASFQGEVVSIEAHTEDE
ncbi:CPXCG motif-containing cysteine-rich protein [Crenothrix sp.]|uniref:CPXCG motif-containing cysteine-rich protein n=1 Tax=Crenothrix sp. TaxID=3100433 RepID=UPI00374D4D95